MSDLGLSIAVSGLLAQQESLDVTSNNIANAGTTGYSRETAELVDNPPIPTPSVMNATGGPGQFGTGVDVQTVTSARDQFLDTQYRQQNVLLGQAQQQSNALSQVETIFGNLSSTTGLNTDLNNFWQAWNTLSQQPEDMPQRTTVVDTATTLADNIQSTNSQLTTLKGNLNSDISGDVTHINDDLNQIATLNNAIQSATNDGLTPNTLLDQRDNLLDDLSTYVNVKTVINSDNSVTLSIAGATAVDGPNAVQLSAIPDGSGNNQVAVNLGGGNTDILQWPEVGGALYGLQQAIGDVQGYVDNLNSLTTTVANAVNSKQESGYGLDGTTGLPFFTSDDPSPIDASNIEVNPTLANDPQEIAASSGVIQSTTTTVGTATTPQVETLAIADGVTVGTPVAGPNQTLQVAVTAAAMNGGNPVTVPVPVTVGESADNIASAIYTALDANAAITGQFSLSWSAGTPDVVLTSNTNGADSTMNVSATGLVDPGDGNNALNVYDLSYTNLNFGAVQDTAGDFYDSMISNLGTAASQANNSVTNQSALTSQLNNNRQSVSGVSIDEEMTNMVQEQNAYEAAAKLINVIAENLQTVINMVPTT